MISYDLTVNIHHPSSSINHWEDQQISGYTTDHATSCILKIWELHFSLCLDVPRHHWLAGSSCVQHTPTTHKRRRMDPSGNGIHIMYNYTIYIYIYIYNIYIYTHMYMNIYIYIYIEAGNLQFPAPWKLLPDSQPSCNTNQFAPQFALWFKRRWPMFPSRTRDDCSELARKTCIPYKAIFWGYPLT